MTEKKKRGIGFYLLCALIVAVAVLLVVIAVGNKTQNAFQNVNSSMDGLSGAPPAAVPDPDQLRNPAPPAAVPDPDELGGGSRM